MQQLVGTRNEDARYDFLLFIGRVLTSCLPDLYLHNTLSRYRLLRLYFRCLFNFTAHSEPNTAGRSRSALNRIILAAIIFLTNLREVFSTSHKTH